MTDKHENDCDGTKNYSDGVFRYCKCGARVMNTFVGAKIKHVRTGKQPIKTIEIKEKST